MDLPFGTQKRVELGRALASEPKLLLLDEPAGGLNHEEVETLMELLRRIRAELDLTMLLVEHHMNMVMRVSDRVVALDFGKKIADGTPAEVQANEDVDPRLPGSRGMSARGRRPLLDVRGLAAQYGPTKVLHGIDFAVAEGGITTILGANGAGKTTLLRAVCNMIRTQRRGPLAGERIDGRRPRTIVRRGVAPRARRPRHLHEPLGRGEPAPRRATRAATAPRSAPTSSACTPTSRA